MSCVTMPPVRHFSLGYKGPLPPYQVKGLTRMPRVRHFSPGKGPAPHYQAKGLTTMPRVCPCSLGKGPAPHFQEKGLTTMPHVRHFRLQSYIRGLHQISHFICERFHR